MNAVITPKRAKVKEPSVEQLAKQKARGNPYVSIAGKRLKEWRDVGSQIRKAMHAKAARLALIAARDVAAEAAYFTDSDVELLTRVGQGVTPSAAEIMALQCLFVRHAKLLDGHPAWTGNSTSAGIVANDPSADGSTTEGPDRRQAEGERHSVRGNGAAEETTKDTHHTKKAQKAAESGPNQSRFAASNCFWGPVIELRLRELVRHPDNRHPAAADIQARAASMRARGQDEPIKVRPAAGGKYQILSGETRWLAAQQLGWKVLDARICDCTDEQALILLAEANAQRQDLNPLDKARLIELGVHVAEAKSKDTKVKVLITRDRNLKLPKCLQPLGGGQASRKGAKGAKGK